MAMVYLKDYYSSMEVEWDIMGLNPWEDIPDNKKAFIENTTIPDARVFFYEVIKEIADNNDLDIDYVPYSGSDVVRNTTFFRYLFSYKALEMIYLIASESAKEGIMAERKAEASSLFEKMLERLTSMGLEYDYDADGTIDTDTKDERTRVTAITVGR